MNVQCLYIYSKLFNCYYNMLSNFDKMLLIVKRSKHIEVRSCFNVFVGDNSVVQLDFIFDARL